MEGHTAQPKSHVTSRLILTIVAAAMGSFQFGYNVGVINAPESLIKSFMNKTQERREGSPMSDQSIRNLWALTVAIFAVGGCIGGVLAGWWATRFGRKGGSLLNIIFGVVSCILLFVSRVAGSYEMIIIGRILIGFHSGLYTGLSPMYLSEISTSSMRGGIGVLHQVAVTAALLLSQILGFPELLGTAEYWNILLGLAIAPCLVQAMILPFCPESPRYLLITKKNEKMCREALMTLRGTADIEDEVNEIKQEMLSCDDEKISIIQLFRDPTLRSPMFIGMVMQLSQQFSGVNGVFFYSTSLFTNVIGSETKARYATSAVGAIMVTMTIVTIPLMDRLGRRTLHLTGLGGMAVFSILVTVTLALQTKVDWFGVASIACVLAYIVFFATGPGSIPWLIVAELFSHDARPAAMSVCVLVNWLSSFVVGFIFPSLQEALTDYTFLPFTVLLVLFFLYTFFVAPETKGKTFEEVTSLWRKNPNSARSSPLEKVLAENAGRTDTKPKYGSTNEAYMSDCENSVKDVAYNTKL
ncbi:hypothetical protein BsWGS_19283 [Bradybaena similaris]